MIDIKFVLSEAFSGIRRHLSLAAAVVVCVTVSLVLLGAATLLSRQVDSLRGYWYDRVEVSVFLCGTSSDDQVCPTGEITPTEKSAVRTKLEGMELTKKLYYESKDQAWERFHDSYRGSKVLTQVDSSSMPESYRVKLTDPTAFTKVAEEVAAMPGVESVQDQRKLLAPFFTVVGGLQTATLAFALAQVAIALLLISNTVRTGVAARRREVAVMRLIGASKAMIRGPFLAEAALAGLVGSVLSIGLLGALQHYVINTALATRGGAVHYLTWTDLAAVSPLLIVGGVATPVLAAAWSLRKHLRV